MQNKYIKPESDVIEVGILGNLMDIISTPENSTVGVDTGGEGIEPGGALSSESPIWDDSEEE